MLLFLMLSCGDKTPYSSERPPTTEATLRLLSAVNNSPLAEVPIYSTVDSTPLLTEEDGRATVPVVQSTLYRITAGGEADMAHLYQGMAGEEPFEVVGYLSDRATTESVYSYLGFNIEQSTGIVVVAVDYSDLRPVYGCSVQISSKHDGAFVFGQSLPALGDSLVENGASFVSFANVSLGTATISVDPPDGVSCYSFPAGERGVDLDVEVYADTVTVAAFQCE